MANTIDKKIVGYKVKTEETPVVEGTTQTTEIQSQLKQKLIRPFKLTSSTYKIKPPTGEDGWYITIADLSSTDESGVVTLKPYEIFINSKNVEHFEFVMLVTRLVSAIFRAVDDPRFIIEEFRAIHSPLGGYRGRPKAQGEKGYWYKSILDEIGEVIESHFEDIQRRQRLLSSFQKVEETFVEQPKVEIDSNQSESLEVEPKSVGSRCSTCSEMAVIRLDGCDTCTSCGVSKCG